MAWCQFCVFFLNNKIFSADHQWESFYWDLWYAVWPVTQIEYQNICLNYKHISNFDIIHASHVIQDSLLTSSPLPLIVIISGATASADFVLLIFRLKPTVNKIIRQESIKTQLFLIVSSRWCKRFSNKRPGLYNHSQRQRIGFQVKLFIFSVWCSCSHRGPLREELASQELEHRCSPVENTGLLKDSSVGHINTPSGGTVANVKAPLPRLLSVDHFPSPLHLPLKCAVRCKISQHKPSFLK